MKLLVFFLTLLALLFSPAEAINKQKEYLAPLQKAEIIVGPFDLHRRYRSMEGPYVIEQFRISDLITSKQVLLPETMVQFVEGRSDGPAPSMMGSSASTNSKQSIKGLGNAADKSRELYWFKSIKVEVLDENDQALPGAEFICHLNLDLDPSFRNKIFPEAEPCHNMRLVTLTQGQTDISFPDGFGVPVASDELWNFTFQVANRTTDKHRRLKHKCTVTFIKDSDLVYPIKALSWYTPYVSVIVDRNSSAALELEHKANPGCLTTSEGVTAANSVPGALTTDSYKRRLSGHWVVPPGLHTYTSPILDEQNLGFASKDRIIHFVWSHVHPLCTSASLLECGKNKKSIFCVRAKTNISKGLEIEKIETISSEKGLKMPSGRPYEIEAKYNNVTNTAQDSMVALGIFFEDNTFCRPNWLFCDKNQAFCGVSAIKSPEIKVPTDYLPPYPLFDPSTDGPLIDHSIRMELNTSAGKIHLELDPKLAPIHATQLYKLLKVGAFNGTSIYRHEANFVLQTNSVEKKVPGQADLTPEMQNLLRRLPLEVASQADINVRHEKWMLSMARYDNPDSAVSSFSIMLADAAHLNEKYTLFGKLIADEVTLQTIKSIIAGWSKGQPYIIEAKEL